MMRMALGFAMVWMLPATAWAAEPATRPNFVIMMCDDQRADALSCAGNTVLQTPNLDRLAREGARFRKMFVTTALCAPSRASLMTGQYAHAHGVINNFGLNPRQDNAFLSDYLRTAGYEVAFCGKSHVGRHFRDRTWDYYFGFQGQGDYLKPRIAEGTSGRDEPYQGYMDDVVTEKAIAWLAKPRSKPFALFLFFKAPHRAWVPAPRHRSALQGTAIPKPPLWDDRGEGKPRAFLMAANMIGQFPDAKLHEDMTRDYYRTLLAVDENVGKVLAALKESRTLDATCVMHTSDNGFFLGEWQRFDKRFMHEPSISVPLLVRYPPLVKSGSLVDAMTLNIDIAPTVLELVGLPQPADMHGRSFVPQLKDATVPGRADWLYEYFEYPDPSHNVRRMRGVRTATAKLIHYFDPPQEFELYDLAKDPEERVNLADRPEAAELRAKLTARLAELRLETGDRDDLIPPASSFQVAPPGKKGSGKKKTTPE